MEYEVGTLYLGFYRNGLLVWRQPGGPGTPVLPASQRYSPERYQGYQQAPMSYPSLYTAGCNHEFNCYEIFQAFQPSLNDQVALICCPRCSYIQEILLLSVYQSYISTPLVTA